jgi:hypothetical protein
MMPKRVMILTPGASESRISRSLPKLLRRFLSKELIEALGWLFLIGGYLLIIAMLIMFILLLRQMSPRT